jgi:hypothetical protein
MRDGVKSKEKPAPDGRMTKGDVEAEAPFHICGLKWAAVWFI